MYVAMWHSCLRRQSGNPKVVASSPFGGEKTAQVNMVLYLCETTG